MVEKPERMKRRLVPRVPEYWRRIGTVDTFPARAGDFIRKRISELPSDMLASHAPSFFLATLLRPLADDGAAIDGHFCAANCREVSQDQDVMVMIGTAVLRWDTAPRASRHV